MHRTLVIRREYLHFVPKYSRYEKRHKNLAAHVSPAFRVEEGDQVTVGQCRPLSKTVRSEKDTFVAYAGQAGYLCADFGTAGSIQRSSRATPYWKGRERVPKVLDRREGPGGCIVVQMIWYEASCNSLTQLKKDMQYQNRSVCTPME